MGKKLASIVLWIVFGLHVGCHRTTRDDSERIQQEITSKTFKTDSLRQAMRYLAQTTPINQLNLNQETRVLLNTWLKTAGPGAADYSLSKLLAGLDPSLLAEVGCQDPDNGQFNLQDVDYLYQCHLMQQLSAWIVQVPVRDRLLEPILNTKLAALDADEAATLLRAYKLFDWTIRNIKLTGVESSQASVKTRDPRAPVTAGGYGYSNTPWKTVLFSSGDFIERGRVFTAMAAQQGIDTCWVSVGATPGAPGDLFAVGVLIGGEMLLLEPKLGFPILDPDSNSFATLKSVSTNDRILRRLNLPQYPYAFEKSDIQSIQLLVDAVPFAATRRANQLEKSLTGEERMVASVDLDGLAERLNKTVPNATVALWHTPLLAQVYSESLREQLGQLSEFTIRYYAEHAIWLMETSVSKGRLLHLAGKFENSIDAQGALKTYMDTRVDDESLQRIAYNPDVRRAFGLVQQPAESNEMFEARVRQAQSLFSRAKFDVAFLLAQLHFDRGDYSSAAYWLEDRVLKDSRAAAWHAPAWYLLARAYTELEKFDEAEEAFTKPTIEVSAQTQAYAINPQDAGNRLRLRYLRRLRAPDES